MASQVTELTFLNHPAHRFGIPFPDHLTDYAEAQREMKQVQGKEIGTIPVAK